MAVGVVAVKTQPQCLSRSSSPGDAACLSRTRASCAASRARIARLSGHRLQLDHKKGAQLPPLSTTLLASEPEDPTSTMLELDERMARLCSKRARLLDVDRPVPQDTTGGSVCRWGSEQTDVPAVVGGDPAGVSPGPVLHRLFESLCFCHPAGAAHSGGQRDRKNRPYRALEEHTAPTTRPFVRVTVSSSTSVVMPEACLLHFLSRYHLDWALLLK